MYQFLKSHFTEVYLDILGRRELYLHTEMLGGQGVLGSLVEADGKGNFYTITPHKINYIKDIQLMNL